MTTCQNCDQPIAVNFCPQCGQKKFKRIDRKYLLDELQYSVIHTNKGFFYSVKKILINPGKTAREFIEGNRVNHYKPILLMLVLAGISAVISYKIIGLDTVMKEVYAKQGLNSAFASAIISVLSNYNSAIMMLLIPFISIFTKIAFWKWGQNYYEHIIMNAYLLIFYTLISIIFFYPVMYLFRHNFENFLLVTNISVLLVPAMMFWFYREFYKDQSWISIIIRILLISIMVAITFMILVFVSIIAYIFIAGPDAMKYLKQQ